MEYTTEEIMEVWANEAEERGVSMQHILEMGTSIRHNQLLSKIQSVVLSMFKMNEILSLQENVALCYLGVRREPQGVCLLDIKQNIDINDLQIVYPDYMLFHTNKFITNTNKTRVAGYPDLIIEVWSPYNSIEEINFKRTLYSTSPVTEHWYLQQDSNVVNCYLGNTVLSEQSLKNLLETQKGLRIDLRDFEL